MTDRIDPGVWRLYVITDRGLSRGRSDIEVVEAAIQGGADVIQLRDKTSPGGELYRTALALRKLTREANVALIVNDRIDIALAVDADGVHVGQSDLPAFAARRILGPGGILGVTAETVEEARQAEKDGADYLGVGPVFEARGTKADAGPPQGPAIIANLRPHTRLPIVAIGGIQAGNARLVREAGAECAAVISAIVGADDIAKAARELKSILSAGDRGR